MALAEQIVASPQLLMGRNHKQQSGFDLVGYEEILKLVESPIDLSKYDPVTAKQNCPFGMPSDARSKTKEAVLEHDNFTCLVVDIDKGNQGLDEIKSKLKGLGLTSFAIYSTLRHVYESLGSRWRILIPLENGVRYAVWLSCQDYLISEFDGDPRMANPAQIFYLPAISSTGKYEFHIEDGGSRLNLEKPTGTFFRRLKRHEKEVELKAVPNDPPPAKQPSINLEPGQISPIDAFNESNPFRDYLPTLGFKKKGNKYLHPRSESSEPGVAILGGRYFSHHGCDPLSDGFTHDVFALFVEHECDGDFDLALRKAGERYRTKEGLTINEHNQNIYRGELVANSRSKPIKSLDEFAISKDQVEELKKEMVGLVYAINHLAIVGQFTVFHASPNGGKTLFTIFGLIQSILRKEIEAENVYYLNCDDNFDGAIEKLSIFNQHGVRMLMPGYNGFESEMLWGLLKQMVKDGQCHGKILVLDTLTKFVDNMDHKQQKSFYNLLRDFSIGRGTVIVLTHQNKNAGENGKKAISGTADLMNNSDAVFGMRNLSSDDQTTIVEFYNEKGRHGVADQLAWEFKNKVDSYQEKLDSIQILDEDKTLRLSEIKRQADRRDKYQDIINVFKTELESGPVQKTTLINNVYSQVMDSRKVVQEVLHHHTGEDSELCQYWTFEKGDKNTAIYSLNKG